MNRFLRYSTVTYNNLFNKNEKHKFAMKHALRIYRSNSIYSFIPKNACTTMRLSLAIENRCIKGIEDFNWLQRNISIFRTDFPSLINADYTFCILRCPYARLASCYLDKIINPKRRDKILSKLMKGSGSSHVSFDVFCKLITESSAQYSNIHWQPQVDFLVYEEYDDYFCIEDFKTAIKTLKSKIALSVIDARSLSKHGLSHLELMSDAKSYSHMLPDEILALKSSGKSPNPKLLYNDELVEIVKYYYQQDIALYSEKFGSEKLMFS